MFQGYTQETVDFMWGIRFNNDRSWFLPRKEIYQRAFLEPTKALAEQVYDTMHEAFPHEPWICKVSRIYRDARRLHGQGPYKDHLWFCLRTGDKDWTGKPSFYFEIAPEYYSYGMGFWCAAPILMSYYRKAIDARPEELRTLVEKFNRQKVFTLDGPEYAKSKGCPDPVLHPWYQKKSINIEHTVPLDEKIYDAALADEIIKGFKELMPFYRYFSAVEASVPKDERGEK